MGAKKSFWGCTALFFGALLLGAGAIGAILYWPVVFNPRFTLPIEGQVVDAVTGEPVAKVLVTSDWTYERPVVVDTNEWGELHRAVTDAEGRFAIPARKITKPWSRFFSQSLLIQHPLYDFMMLRVRLREKVEEGEIMDGGVVLPLRITKLADRFTGPEDDEKFSISLRGKSPEFFKFMSDNFNVTYDLPAIMETWRFLAYRFAEPANPQKSLAVYEFNIIEQKFKVAEIGQ